MISDKQFQYVVANSGLTDDQLARMLKISRPTVKLWRTGENFPHEIIRPKLVSTIRNMVRPIEFFADINVKLSNRDPELILDRPAWAVIYRGNCVDRELELRWEPSPSNRDEKFYEECRFTFEEALEVAKKWKES